MWEHSEERSEYMKSKVDRKVAKSIGNKIGVDWSRISLSQFRKGMNEEFEHSKVTKGNLTMTGQIALDHLESMPNYYDKLDRMEKGKC